MDFATKPSLVYGATTYNKGEYQKPTICPWCGFGTDGNISGVGTARYGADSAILCVSILCTHCNKNFVALYTRFKNGTEMQYMHCVPQPAGIELHDAFTKISERFVEIHRQSEAAEANGLIDLAAMGYRTALELLVKDYAIKELKKDPDEVKNKHLAKAIGMYLQQDKLVKTADVVRILGNDRVHYEREHPKHDFSTLKHYYRIFLDLISTQYDITHPPVVRQ